MKVNISGTISKDKRADSGLDEIGEKLHSNRLQRMMVVGMVEFHAYHDVAGKAETLAIRFTAIEPLTGDDDMAARNLLDSARKARGVGSTELTLFDSPDPDSEKGPWPGDVDYFAPVTAEPGITIVDELATEMLDELAAETETETGGQGEGGTDGQDEPAKPETPVKAKRATRKAHTLTSVSEPK